MHLQKVGRQQKPPSPVIAPPPSIAIGPQAPPPPPPDDGGAARKAAAMDVAAGWEAVFDPSNGTTYYKYLDGTTAWSLPELVPGLAGTTRQIIVFGDESMGTLSKGGVASAHVTGRILGSNKQFWCTKESGMKETGMKGTGMKETDTPWSFTAGESLRHIKGWDLGVIGMKVGEVRVLVIPANEGYGKKGFKGKEMHLPRFNIPGKATLHLTVELVGVRYGDVQKPPANAWKPESQWH